MTDSFGLLPYMQDEYEAFESGDYKAVLDHLGDLEERLEGQA